MRALDARGVGPVSRVGIRDLEKVRAGVGDGGGTRTGGRWRRGRERLRGREIGREALGDGACITEGRSSDESVYLIGQF